MSWDIYGNPLRSGYCEVHPDVHESWPCAHCMEEEAERRAYLQAEADYYRRQEEQADAPEAVQ